MQTDHLTPPSRPTDSGHLPVGDNQTPSLTGTDNQGRMVRRGYTDSVVSGIRFLFRWVIVTPIQYLVVTPIKYLVVKPTAFILNNTVVPLYHLVIPAKQAKEASLTQSVASKPPSPFYDLIQYEMPKPLEDLAAIERDIGRKQNRLKDIERIKSSLNKELIQINGRIAKYDIHKAALLIIKTEMSGYSNDLKEQEDRLADIEAPESPYKNLKDKEAIKKEITEKKAAIEKKLKNGSNNRKGLLERATSENAVTEKADRERLAVINSEGKKLDTKLEKIKTRLSVLGEQKKNLTPK